MEKTLYSSWAEMAADLSVIFPDELLVLPSPVAWAVHLMCPRENAFRTSHLVYYSKLYLPQVHLRMYTCYSKSGRRRRVENKNCILYKTVN